MTERFNTENPVVRDELWRRKKSYYVDKYHFYFEEDDDEPDWDSMRGGHDDYSSED